jgi:hypothetical protein
LDRLSEDSIIARPLPRTTKVNRFDSTPTNGKMLKMKKKHDQRRENGSKSQKLGRMATRNNIDTVATT